MIINLGNLPLLRMDFFFPSTRQLVGNEVMEVRNIDGNLLKVGNSLWIVLLSSFISVSSFGCLQIGIFVHASICQCSLASFWHFCLERFSPGLLLTNPIPPMTLQQLRTGRLSVKRDLLGNNYWYRIWLASFYMKFKGQEELNEKPQIVSCQLLTFDNVC